ncbi:hypothetical protein D3C80_1766630 [compost metagenome]
MLALAQTFAGLDQAQLHLVLQGRKPGLFLEAAHEVVLAQTGHPGEVVEFEFLTQVRVHELSGLLEAVALFSSFDRAPFEQLA